MCSTKKIWFAAIDFIGDHYRPLGAANLALFGRAHAGASRLTTMSENR
jgi:hypothetical protein